MCPYTLHIPLYITHAPTRCTFSHTRAPPLYTSFHPLRTLLCSYTSPLPSPRACSIGPLVTAPRSLQLTRPLTTLEKNHLRSRLHRTYRRAARARPYADYTSLYRLPRSPAAFPPQLQPGKTWFDTFAPFSAPIALHTPAPPYIYL